LFSRFSPASKRVLHAAEQECRNRNHYYVGVEHMLVSLLEDRDPKLEERLAELGVRRDHLWDGILVTPRLRTVVELAGRIAGHGPLEPPHLLQAILDEGGGSAAELLVRLGAPPRRKE
jgi:ATP-dependent Clp protease ATP-binding subunit ClpC